MNAKQVAALTGVSVRTLHHYDDIGLLRPERNPENGYRSYAEDDLDTLQQILFFRACGFPLAKIGALLRSPDFDREQAFALQRKYLLHERARIDAMLETLGNTIRAWREERTMTNEEKFSGFDFSHNPYEDEARERWGDKAVDESNAYVAGLGKEGQKQLEENMNALFRDLAAVRQEDPASETAQAAIDKMYHFFNGNFGAQYSLEAFAGLGEMYVADTRFTKNIDKFGEGTAAFLRDAMKAYAEKNAK